MAERDDTVKYESEFRHIPTGDTSSQEFQIIKAEAAAVCNHGDLSSRALVLSTERRRCLLGPLVGSTSAKPRDITRNVFPRITEKPKLSATRIFDALVKGGVCFRHPAGCGDCRASACRFP